MFKVTLKIKPNGEWVDGPVVLVLPRDMDMFSQTHSYFKVEDATLDDGYSYEQWTPPKAKIPSGFKEMFS